MTKEYKKRIKLALENAADMIYHSIESVSEPKDVNEIDQKGLERYEKACIHAAKRIKTLANQYK